VNTWTSANAAYTVTVDSVTVAFDKMSST